MKPRCRFALRPFHRQQYRPAPFPTNANALHEAHTVSRTPPQIPDLRVGRHERDEKGRGHPSASSVAISAAFRSKAVAVMPERSPRRSVGHEADRISTPKAVTFQPADRCVGKKSGAKDESGDRSVQKGLYHSMAEPIAAAATARRSGALLLIDVTAGASADLAILPRKSTFRLTSAAGRHELSFATGRRGLCDGVIGFGRHYAAEDSS